MEFQNVHPGVCISHQTGPSTIVFGGGSDRELRLKLLTPEREKEDTNHHGNANNRTQARWNDEHPITHRLTSPGVLLYQYPVFVRVVTIFSRLKMAACCHSTATPGVAIAATWISSHPCMPNWSRSRSRRSVLIFQSHDRYSSPGYSHSSSSPNRSPQAGQRSALSSSSVVVKTAWQNGQRR